MEFCRKHKKLILCLLPILLTYIICNDIFMLVEVPSESMEPAIPAGSLVIARRITKSAKIRRGDIIVFDHEGEIGHKEQYIKRVFGIPGDIIEYTEKKFWITGTKVDVYSFMGPEKKDAKYEGSKILLEEGQYFVMGDNRANSMDSRNWPDNIKVQRNNIKAVAIAVFITEGNSRLIRLQIPEAFSVIP